MAGPLKELCNARFVDIERGCYYPNGTRLLLNGERIQAVLLPGEATAPAAQPVDLGGLAALPGLFNTHCHIQLCNPSPLAGPAGLRLVKRWGRQQIVKNMADCQRRGVLHLRDAFHADRRPTLDLSAQIAARRISGPRLYQSVLVAPQGFALDIRSLYAGASRLKEGVSEAGMVLISPDASTEWVRAAVDQAVIRHQAHSITFYDQEWAPPQYKKKAMIFDQPQLDVAADQARKRGLTCTMHICSLDGFRRGVRAGVTSLVHLPLDGLLSERDVKDALAAGVILEPGLTTAYFMAWPLTGGTWLRHPLYRWLEDIREQNYADLIETFWLPQLAEIALDLPSRIASGKTRRLGLIDQTGPMVFWGRMAGTGLENLQELFAAGVPVALGTDAGMLPISPAAVVLELHLMRLFLHGFDGCQALRTAALTSAAALGLSSDYGALSGGKIADIVLAHGDPLSNPDQVGRLAEGVFVAGEKVFWSGRVETG